MNGRQLDGLPGKCLQPEARIAAGCQPFGRELTLRYPESGYGEAMKCRKRIKDTGIQLCHV
jgi:hypothetical protein